MGYKVKAKRTAEFGARLKRMETGGEKVNTSSCGGCPGRNRSSRRMEVPEIVSKGGVIQCRDERGGGRKRGEKREEGEGEQG